jgi:hypothetical protein
LAGFWTRFGPDASVSSDSRTRGIIGDGQGADVEPETWPITKCLEIEGRSNSDEISCNDPKNVEVETSIMATLPKAPKPISLGRHSRNCTVCAHKDRDEIEREFINWTAVKVIAKIFGLKDRTAIYRHARASGLFAKRQRNIRAALEKIIEQAGDVEVSSAAVVAAVQAYAKINSQGEWIERVERVSQNDLFERMTRDELDVYAKYGSLPEWFKKAVGATGSPGHKKENNEESKG